MSVMSAAETSEGTGVSVEFSGPGERGRRVTELHFRELHFREQRVRQVRGGEQRAIRGPVLADRHRQRAPAPVRLTRRGRAVVAILVILAAATAAALLWLSAAAGAQASSHGQPARAGYQGMTQVVVRPGDTLWSVASAAEPSADTWAVIQQIINANALSGDAIHAGQLLWVPKG
jgi:nucleoid-associated protein YgaU